MRQFITIMEHARNAPAKPFDQITVEDVIRVMFDIDDIHDVFTSGRWEDLYYDNEALPEIEVPKRSSDIPAEHMAALIHEYTKDVAAMKDRVAPLTRQHTIEIKRRLSRLSDLSRPLGIHWSLAAAEVLDTEHFGSHVIYATVDSDDVDWLTTLARGVFWWHAEAEITPQAGAALVLQRLEFGDDALGTA